MMVCRCDADIYDSETTAFLPMYIDAAAEKITRGGLKSRVDHALNAKTLVILDSLNYIKGFRYELYCSCRAEGTQHCVVRTISSVIIIIIIVVDHHHHCRQPLNQNFIQYHTSGMDRGRCGEITRMERR